MPQNQDLYREFADFYARGPWPRFSERVAAAFPDVLNRFGATPQSMLDIACGEGSFAVAMAQQGIQMTGLDYSPEMIACARARALKEQVAVRYVLGDMRSLPFSEAFDVAACWYDSLNYLLDYEELRSTFAGACRSLKPGGLFVFDMNTIYALAVLWQRNPASVELDTDEQFVAGVPKYDFERNVATLRIVGFAKRAGSWMRMEEEHQERGYTVGEIRDALKAAGLEELACWGNPREMREPGPDAGRLWFVTRRP